MCPLNRKHRPFGGNIINLINGFLFFFFSFPQILIYLTMQWEMMSHFNEKHKEIEKPRCYFLSSVVLCVFFFSSCCCSNERKLGENYSITSSPSPSHTSTPPPLDSLNRHVLTRVDLCCKSCYWFLFFFFSLDDVRRWRLACRFSYISSRQISAAWRRYVISCFSGPRQIREEKKKLVPKLLEEETES